MPPPIPPKRNPDRRPVDQQGRPLPKIVPLTLEQEILAAVNACLEARRRQAAKDKP